MPTCIYCRCNSPDPFPAEHVIPRSLGAFRNNLTLRCVCGDCNHYFANNLELYFGRETGESIVRFQYNLRDTIAGSPHSRLTAKLRIPGPLFGTKVLLGPNASATGIEIIYLPQVAFANAGSDDWEWYLPDELSSELLEKLSAGSQLRYFFTSPEQEQELRGRLRELGFGDSKHIGRAVIAPQPEMITRVTYLFDEVIRRCIAKIAFNYMSYALKEDTWLLLQADFDPVRRYVRYGEVPVGNIVSFFGEPRLSQENRKSWLVEGHLLAVGWNMNENIVCNLSIFDAMTYQVVLCRRYQGLWFSLSSMHSFDLSTKEVKKLPGHILVPLQQPIILP